MNWAVAGQCGFVSLVFVVDGQVSMIVEEYLLGVLCSFFPQVRFVSVNVQNFGVCKPLRRGLGGVGV